MTDKCVQKEDKTTDYLHLVLLVLILFFSPYFVGDVEIFFICKRGDTQNIELK